jgi:hypothetical protein
MEAEFSLLSIVLNKKRMMDKSNVQKISHNNIVMNYPMKQILWKACVFPSILPVIPSHGLDQEMWRVAEIVSNRTKERKQKMKNTRIG